jgi:hypothetical protein
MGEYRKIDENQIDIENLSELVVHEIEGNYPLPDIVNKIDKTVADITSGKVVGDSAINTFPIDSSLIISKTVLNVNDGTNSNVVDTITMGSKIGVTYNANNRTTNINIDTEISERETADTTEATARATADTTLQSNIDSEITARQNADSTLQTNLNAEITARSTAISNEIINRDIAISNHNIANDSHQDIRQGIIDETNDRALADDSLQSNIDLEADTRADADTILQDNINNEIADREQGDTDTLSDSKDYTDQQIANAELSKQIWLPAVQTLSDLEAITPPSPDTVNYLCRVINDATVSNNGTYQWIAGDTEWTYFGDNLDFIDETELNDAIETHNTSVTSHNDIRGAISNHIGNTNNPHSVTKAQIGLTNVQNVDQTNAANITSGTLPIARGGTGNTNNQSASCSGNSATATKLATARNINGVAFDGTKNIDVPSGFQNAVAKSINLGNAMKAVILVTSSNQGGGNGNISTACFVFGAYYNNAISVQRKMWGDDNITLKNETANTITIDTHFNVPFNNNVMTVLWTNGSVSNS